MSSEGFVGPVVRNAREVLALNVIRLRGQHGWSQEVLAFECGLHRTFVAHVERKVRNISLDNIERLANAFGVETFELLTPHNRDAL
jgi:transcriptional regulator with XRE-family HTH domain